MKKLRLPVFNMRGDSLVEVVLSLALMSGVLVTAYTISNRSYNLGMQARERTQAVSIAQGELEKLRAHRDVVMVEQAASTTFTMTGTEITDCSAASGCTMTYDSADGEWRPTQCPAAGCAVSGLYTTTVRYQKLVDRINGTIQVRWDPSGGGPQNIAQIPFVLIDTRQPDVRDCSEVGGAGCV